jgi:hypothetical protein
VAEQLGWYCNATVASGLAPKMGMGIFPAGHPENAPAVIEKMRLYKVRCATQICVNPVHVHLSQ